ncbi:Pentatricopeptide repeat-containing protein [Glycine max]|nr:Pentatricopeptide repeat-containing protein [Glycine max]
MLEEFFQAIRNWLCHAGMVNEDYKYFHDMECVHGIKTLMMHYGAMVDVLGRAARVGERVRKKFLLMEPRRGGNLVIVANMFAEVEMWEKAANVGHESGGMKKVAGESCADLGGSMHRFFAGYDPCPDLVPVYHLLDGFNLHLKMVN